MAFRVMLEPLVAPWVQDGGRGHRRCFRAGLTKRIVAGGEQGWGMVSCRKCPLAKVAEAVWEEECLR